MIGEDLHQFFDPLHFAEEIMFTNGRHTLNVNMIFDEAGSLIDGVILESARLIGPKSEVDRDWQCRINGTLYRVMSIIEGSGGACEYVLENISGQSARHIQ